MNPLPDFPCVMRRCWTRNLKEREDNRKKCLKALLFSFRFVLVCFFWAAGRQMKGVQLLLLLPLRLSAKGSFFVILFFMNVWMVCLKKGLIMYAQGKLNFTHAQGLKTTEEEKKKHSSWFCTGVIRLISLVLVLYIWLFMSLIWIWDLFFLSRNVVVLISFKSYFRFSLI